MERRGYQPYSPEQRQALRDEVFAKLEAGVASVQDSESFQRYLNLQAKFPRYSPNNIMLILMQYPEATQVNSFNRWVKDFERKVKKGEKAIRILAPTFGKDEDTGDQVLRGFIPVPVFDIGQTEGKPVPTPETPLLLEGEEGPELFDRLMDYAQRERVHVRLARGKLELPEGSNGDYNPRSREIRIKGNPMRQMAKTLSHELSHHVHTMSIGAESADRGERETVAEGSAYVITQHFGLDSGEYTFPYIAAWAGNKARLVEQLENIHRVSSHIIDALDGLPVTANGAQGRPDAEPALPVPSERNTF